MYGTDPVVPAPSCRRGGCRRGEDPAGNASLLPQFWGGSRAGRRLPCGWGCCGKDWAWSPQWEVGWSRPCSRVPGHGWEDAALGQHQNPEFPKHLGSGGKWSRVRLHLAKPELGTYCGSGGG